MDTDGTGSNTTVCHRKKVIGTVEIHNSIHIAVTTTVHQQDKTACTLDIGGPNITDRQPATIN